ncbi:MAG: hypothetical protein IJO43_01080 [Bacilli bacterium]|nr:hypothetical protein [Bacilli bacterium]
MVELQERLYRTVLKEKELTTKVLRDNGISAKDINILIEANELVRTKRGCYALPSAERLYYYGIGLTRERKYEEAHEYFLKCHELSPNHSGACFKLFFWEIDHRNYDGAIKYINGLLSVENKYYLNDAKYYLYLLSFITELPRYLQAKVKSFSDIDFMVYYDDKRYTNVKEHTRVRRLAYYQKFSNALKELNDIIDTNHHANQMEVLEKTLLSQSIRNKKILTVQRIEWLKNKEYERLFRDLNLESYNHELSRSNKYLFSLLNDYIEINNTRKVPSFKRLSSEELLSDDAFFCALDYKDYRMALKLSEQHNSDPERRDTSLIYIMLRDIVGLINEIENKKKEVKPVSPITTFSEIIELLSNKDMDNAVTKVHQYLTSIGKEKYEFLVAGLIKISILEQDDSFSKPMLLLNELSKGDIAFDVSDYISSFYDSVQNKKFKEARIYLDIISKSKELGTSENLVESLNKMLEILGQSTENENNNPAEVIDYTNDEDYIFLTQKSEYLNEKRGIVVLEPMDRIHRKKIHHLVEKFSSMDSFSIGEGEKRRIVLRYVHPEWIDVDALKLQYQKDLAARKYKKCVDYYKTIISLPKPHISTYYKLGVYLGKIGSYSESLELLTVAYHLFESNPHLRNEANQVVLLDLINKTKKKMEEVKIQPELQDQKTQQPKKEKKVSSSKTTSSNQGKDKPKSRGRVINNFLANITPTQEYFGITKIDEISIMINDMEMSITEACGKCGLTEEETSLVRLIYARDCYSQGNYEVGDKLFKVVERSKDKTPRLKSALDEIRSSKPFYVHRKESGKQLLKSFKVKN